MARLSHYAPGEYRPIAMKFDGPTGGFVKEHNPVGQTVWAMGRFRIPKFSGPSFINGSKVILHAAGNGNASLRLGLGVCAAHRLVPSEANRMYFSVQNSTPTTFTILFSKMEVADDAWHSFLCSFNAATAEFTFKIDGVDADDTTQAGRALATGTMTTTAGSLIHVGENLNIGSSSFNHWAGEISVFAYGEGFRSNWNDFFFPNNLPKRLDHAGFTEFGGGVYGPPRSLFDGSTGYYSKALTTVGNKQTYVAEFTINSFATGGVAKRLMALGPQTRVLMSALPSDHATPESRDKIMIGIQNPSSVYICLLISSMVVCDGLPHVLFFSYDSDLGTATFIIDGVNADWTGHPARVAPSVGTTANGATTFYVGCRGGPVEFWNGSIGYLGYKEAYLTNWQDFMDGNKRREIDQATWRQWRGQPKFWQSAAAMEASQGSEGAMTKNGTITVVPNSLPLIYHPYCDMENNMGLIGRMRRGGKCAPVVSGVLLRGTKDAPQNQGNVLMHFSNPQTAVSPVIYDRSYFQVINTSTPIVFTTGWSIDSNGYAYKAGSYTQWLTNYGQLALPVKASATRMHQIHFRHENATPVVNGGVSMRFNALDGSNLWVVSLQWNGSAWLFDLGEYTNPVYTSRNSLTTTTVTFPMHGIITVFDEGDTIVATIVLYNVTTPANMYTGALNYTVANRIYKTATGVEVTHQNDPGTNMRYRNFIVMDM